jgi:hypothetical protein
VHDVGVAASVVALVLPPGTNTASYITESLVMMLAATATDPLPPAPLTVPS